MRLLNAVGVLMIASLLMGSKLIVTVPQHGALVSATGLFACSAGESCTFVATGPIHGEVFTALSNHVSEFSRWNNDVNAVCPGDIDSSCAASASSGDALAFANATSLSMQPLFKKRSSQRSPKSQFDVTSTHTAHFYEVDGATSRQIWRQLRSSTNPLLVAKGGTTRPLAESTFSYRYTYQPVYDSNQQTCSVASGEIQLEYNTTLPQLKALADRQERDRRQWLKFQAVLIKHEAEHQQVYRQLTRELPNALASVRQVRCDQLAESVSSAMSRAAKIIKTQSDQLDLNTTAGNHRSEKPLPSPASLTISGAGSQVSSPVIS